MAEAHQKKIIVSWIGHTDLRAMAPAQTQSLQDQIVKIAHHINPPDGGMGPVKTMLEQISYDEAYLLSDYPDKVNNAYLKWLGHSAHIIQAQIDNPTDYKEVFVKADHATAQIISQQHSSYVLIFLLSPGTPTMAAIWILLGKTKYHPAKFFQTFEGKAQETDIPFDVTVDYVPELLKGSDRIFQHLAAQSPQDIEGFEDIIGDSQAIRFAVGRAQKAAIRDVPVLLMGESGTGKEMFARAIHASSRRKDNPFKVLNCAAIPKELLESQLFGHKKGSFTGATDDFDGLFKQAHGGTLFLDEIGECDPDIQAKLLRVLQPPLNQGPCYREFYPVGGKDSEHADVRVIAATNRNLVEAIENNDFREDLYYRLAVISIKLPPLRERKSDIPRLAKSILDRINRDFERQDPTYKHKNISNITNAFVKKHPWPGNVRQLYNTLLQAAVMSDNEIIEPDEIISVLTDMPDHKKIPDVLNHPLGDDFNLEKHLESIQVHYLQRAMEESGGVKTKAANLLGLKNYQTLDAQLKRLNVHWKQG